MKTKRQNTIAKFTNRADKAKNLGHEKELIARHIIVDKKTEKVVVDCRVYMGRSSSASTVYASVWITCLNKPENWEYTSTSGHGSAGGYGYHKASAAIDSALRSAGVELYGSPYGEFERYNHSEKRSYTEDELKTIRKKALKERAYINGCGDSAIKNALLAVAYAAGCKDAVMV